MSLLLIVFIILCQLICFNFSLVNTGTIMNIVEAEMREEEVEAAIGIDMRIELEEK